MNTPERPPDPLIQKLRADQAEISARYVQAMAAIDRDAAAIRKQQRDEVWKLYRLLYVTMAAAIAILTVAWFGVYWRSWRVVIGYFAFETTWWVIGFLWARRYLGRVRATLAAVEGK